MLQCDISNRPCVTNRTFCTSVDISSHKPLSMDLGLWRLMAYKIQPLAILAPPSLVLRVFLFSNENGKAYW